MGCGGDLVASHWRSLLWGLPILLLSASAWAGGPFQALAWPSSFALMGGACLANAKGCGRTHCHATGPLYLLAALLSLGVALGWGSLSYRWIAAGAALGTLGAYVWEWSRGRYLGPASAPAGAGE